MKNYSDNETISNLLHNIEQTMESQISQRKEVSLDAVYRHLSKTDGFLFLKLHEGEVSPQNFVIAFIRFFTEYSTDLDTISKYFTLLINSIKKTAAYRDNPAIRYTVTGSFEDFVAGYLTPETLTNNPIEQG